MALVAVFIEIPPGFVDSSVVGKAADAGAAAASTHLTVFWLP